MRITFIFLFALIFISPTLSSQSLREERKALRAQERLDKWNRKDSLQRLPINTYLSLDLISTVFPNPLGRLNIGYSTPIRAKWSIGGSAGIGFNATSWVVNNEDYFLWEVRPEILYNLGKGRRFQHYLGLELFYIYHTQTLRNGNFEPVNDLDGAIELIAFDRTNYKRVKTGVLVNFGEYINFSDRWAMRTTVGIGVRRKDNSFSNLVNPQIENFDDGFFFDLSASQREGVQWGPEFNFDLRLIYKIK